MAKERSKAVFSFHILLDKRIWVNIIVLLRPKLCVRSHWKIAKCGINCISENNRYGTKTEGSPTIFFKVALTV